MLVFPQLQTGANAQYPLMRTDVYRTAANELADGGLIKLADESGEGTRWEVRLDGLSDAEWALIAELHDGVEGRLRTFTMLDPLSNLFAWSEDPSQDEWVKDPFISVTGGIEDPRGREGAFSVVNSGAAPQSIRQIFNAPGEFHYCCSVWARSAGSSAVSIRRGSVTEPFALTADWVRISSSGSGAGSGDVFSAGFTLGPGVSVELYGPQLEAQPAAGAYWRTTARGGVYEKVRFAEDRLDLVARDREANSGVLRLTSVE